LQPDESLAASSQLHKQLLAQEVVKLRREVATLRAAANTPGPVSSSEETEIRRLKQETLNLESQKQAIIAQANAQKALLAKEIKSLRTEVEKVGGGAPPSNMSQPGSQVNTVQAKEVAALMERRREFEENFTRTIRDLRKELEQSNIKSLATTNQVPLSVRALIQLSNERIEKAMEEAAQVPVEERLHIETLRLFMENAKLRKNLNDYSEGILHNTLSRIDGGGAGNRKTGSFFGII
jgi:hypothetical protein